MGEGNDPVRQHGVAHEEIDVSPSGELGEIGDGGGELGGGLGLGRWGDVDDFDVEIDGVEVVPEGALHGGEYLYIPAGDMFEVTGVFDDEERGTLEVEIVGDDADGELQIAGGEAMIVGVDTKAGVGVFDGLAEVGIAEGGVALDKGEVLFFGVADAAGGATEVNEGGLGGVDGAVAGLSGAHTVVDIVVGDLEIGVVESVELFVNVLTREQTGTGHGGGIASGVRLEEVAEVVLREADEDAVREATIGADPDAGVVEGFVAMDEAGTDNADPVDGGPTDHVFEPAWLNGFNVVVEMKHEGSIGGLGAEVYES